MASSNESNVSADAELNGTSSSAATLGNTSNDATDHDDSETQPTVDKAEPNLTKQEAGSDSDKILPPLLPNDKTSIDGDRDDNHDDDVERASYGRKSVRQIVTRKDLEILFDNADQPLTEKQAIEALRGADTAIDAALKFRKEMTDAIDLREEMRLRIRSVAGDLNDMLDAGLTKISVDLLSQLVPPMQALETELRYTRNEMEGDVEDLSFSKAKGAAMPRRVYFLPEVNKVTWTEFIDRMYSEPGDSCLEILDALPRSNKGEFRKGGRAGVSKTGGKAQQAAGPAAPNADVNEKLQELPELLRVRSTAVIRLLVQLLHGEMTVPEAYNNPIDFLRPYKLMSYADVEIRQRLKELREKLDEKEAYLELCLKEHQTVQSEMTEQATDAKDTTTTTTKKESVPNGVPTKTDSEEKTKQSDYTRSKETKTKEPSKEQVSRDKYYEEGPCPYFDSQIFTSNCKLESLTYPDLAEAYNEFAQLVKFMDEYIIPRRNAVQKNPKNLYFSDLWYMFEPGKMIYAKDPSVPQKVWQVVHCTGGRRLGDPLDAKALEVSKLAIDCFHLDYDGRRWRPVFQTFEMASYTGTQLATDLPYLLFDVAVAEGLVTREGLIEAGTEFLTCIDNRHRYYSGRSIDTDFAGKRLTRPNPDDLGMNQVYSKNVESQVIVDFEKALQMNPTWNATRQDTSKLFARADDRETFCDATLIEDDRKWDTRYKTDELETLEKLWASWEQGKARPEADNLMLLTDRVFAFILRDREWACLKCSGHAFREIEKRDDAWNDLMIPIEHKLIVQSLIEARFSRAQSSSNEFDLIRDKGKGLIVLLHGAPGVGKTSTAECVAEFYGKPLLPITCGDLGLTAERVEAKLQESFQLAQAWDCVLLLDEADVFLATRTVDDIQRNALVSVFLRVLEYYEGILFLTTNRVGSFDEAFKSRIHMSLHYKALDWNQTEKIWKSQMRRAKTHQPPVACDEDSLLAFAQQLFDLQVGPSKDIYGPVWNGRQIRNAFQSAIAMAKRDSLKHKGIVDSTTDAGQQLLQIAIEVTHQHFERVARVANAFNDYLTQLKRNHNDSDIAKRNQLRNDDHDPNRHMHPQADPYNRQYNRTPQPAQYGGSFPNANTMPQYGQNYASRPQQFLNTGMIAPQQQQQYGSNVQYTSQQPQQYANTQPQFARMQPQQPQPAGYEESMQSQQQPKYSGAPLQAPQAGYQSPLQQSLDGARRESIFDPPQRTYSYAEQQGGAAAPQRYNT